jgi:hypothetical protein
MGLSCGQENFVLFKSLATLHNLSADPLAPKNESLARISLHVKTFAKKRARIEEVNTAKNKVSVQCAKCLKNNVSHPYLKFKCVPQYPVDLEANPTLQSVVNREKKILLHEEVMDCVVGNPRCKSKKYICNEHKFEVITKDKTFTFKGKQITWSFQLTVPIGADMKSSLLPS